MKCPHCREAFFSNPQQLILGEDAKDGWLVVFEVCPACRQMMIFVVRGFAKRNTAGKMDGIGGAPRDNFLVYPRGAMRPAAPPEVAHEIAGDYDEACLVLSVSPKAAAALGRRCLQAILEMKAGVKPGANLADQIEQVLASKALPSHLAESIDYVRNVGNFGAHPLKSQTTGMIVTVEEGEAEWTLDVVELLFDFYFVQPELAKKKRDALDKKLQEAGKRPMKT